MRLTRQFPHMEQCPFVDETFHEWSRINLQESVEAASQLPGSFRMAADEPHLAWDMILNDEL
ncbi:MAG: hypothetical protein F4Z66_03890 [Gammaproteobacteria bacterium]|nr:hypothetical protein [Gammaproteobacteria bacterium]